MSANKNSSNSEKELFKIATDIVLPIYGIKFDTIEQIKLKDTKKQRAVYKIISQNNIYCLKKIYFNEADLLFMYSAMQWLYKNGLKVPILLKDKFGNRYVKAKDFLFILTPWVPGIKCDFDNFIHLTMSAENLAIVHKCSKNFFPIQGSSQKKRYDNLYISINKRFNKLLSCYNTANKNKDKFSKIFLDSFDANIELAKFALEVSSTINFDNLSKALCHGDYVNKNLLIDNNCVYMIDFDKCGSDYCMADLSYFLRRLLKRNDTNWNFDIAKSIILTYDKHNKLTIDDIRYLMVYLAFPQKYWRISRDYYASIDKCNKKSCREALLSTISKTNNQKIMVEKFKIFFFEKYHINF
ncbi:MAG: CotS family spore coat protein [Sarcina sp.]